MKGTPEIVRAAEAAIIATMSGSFTKSWLRTVHITKTSCLKPGTKSGRMGRSINRAVSVSFSDGRASLLKNHRGFYLRRSIFLDSALSGGKNPDQVFVFRECDIRHDRVSPALL